MAADYDVIVMGGGPAGEHAAGQAAMSGLRTALIERDLVGGECSFWACMPSKTLLRPGQALAEVCRVPGAQQAVTGMLDTNAALARRDWMTADWDDKNQVQWLDMTGVSLVRGRARLAGERRVAVDKGDGTQQRLSAGVAVILATGSAPAVPPIEGLREIRTWDNRDATSAHHPPKRLLVLGGGAVGVEMAQAWKRLGSSEVTIVEAAERLLPGEEPFASEQVAEALTADGIDVITATKMISAHRDNDAAPVTGTLADGRKILADEILVAVGRKPRTADIGLESVGLESGRPVPVDDALRATGVPGGWLYAIGDVNGIAPLTHMGKYHAGIAVDVILGRPASALAGHRAVPRVTFTDPQVASVGLTAAQAREQGIPVRTVAIRLEEVAAAPIIGERIHGTAQLVVAERGEVIVGATITGPGVGEMLQAATIAIVGEVPMAKLRHAVAAFPTLSEIWLELFLAYEANGQTGQEGAQR